VEVADGEVVGGGVGVVEVEVGDAGLAGGGLQDVADVQVLGLDEGGLGLVVEGVVEGGGEGAAAGRLGLARGDRGGLRGYGL